MSNVIRKTILKSDIKAGMTVEVEGCFITVTKSNLPKKGFEGWSFEGSAYPRTITQIQFLVPTSKGVVLR